MMLLAAFIAARGEDTSPCYLASAIILAGVPLLPLGHALSRREGMPGGPYWLRIMTWPNNPRVSTSPSRAEE